MRRIICHLISAFLIFTVISQAGTQNQISNIQREDSLITNLPKYFYKRFEGNVGDKYTIVMNLSRRDTILEGNYYCTKKGIPIFLNNNSRIDDDGNIYLQEEIGNYDTSYIPLLSEEFKGRFINAHEIKGYWEKPNNKGIIDFILREKYPTGCASLEIKRFSREYSNGSEKADIEFLFPSLINFPDKNAARIINSKIEKTFLTDYNIGDRNTNWKSYDEMTNDFVNRYKGFINDTSLSLDYKPMWENNYFTNVIFNSDNILSLENIEFRFEGGAHPLTFYIYANYDLKTGNKITLDDLLVPNYKAELDKIGEIEIRKTYTIKNGVSFEKAGYFIKENEFHLNNNFAITKAGLLFRFGQYEIGPYVIGAPSVFIPYKEIKSLVKHKGLLESFDK